MEVSVRELKNNLSLYLRRVQTGEEIIVTSRRRPVAQLSAVRRRPEDAEAETIRRINALPLVRPGKGGKVMGAENPIPWRPGEKTFSDIVLEERE